MFEEVIQRAWPEWRVEEKIGKGGFGTVFKVDKTGGISMPSAVKVISVPEDEAEIDFLEAEGYSEEQSELFFRECLSGLEKEIELMAKLKFSNNIVKIEDYKIVEKEEGFGWFVLVRMELLTPLTALLRQGTLREEEVIKLGIDISSALELCEKEGIIHRDIKPANIFVDRNGNYKLGDFGIARELGSRSVKTVAGTEQYIAPEVLVGKYDARADIYSLGLVLYSLLNNNNLPFLNNVTKVNPVKRAEAIKRRLEGYESFPTPMNASEEMTDLLAWTCLYDKEGRWKSEERDVPYTEKRIGNASCLKKELSDVLSGNYVLRGERTVKVSRPPEPVPEPEKKKKILKLFIVLLVSLLLVGGGIVFGVVLSNREDGEQGKNPENSETENYLTVTPKATEVPTATAEPTEEPEPTKGAEPTEEPDPTEEPEPTEAPEPTEEPDPTEEPEPTEVPEPTEAPEPTEHVHVYTEDVMRAATCGEEGEKTYTCSECGETYTEVLVATGEHSYENDCDKSCDVCGKTRSVSHTYTSKTTKKATCGEEGEKTYFCSVCGDSYTEDISATGKHSYDNACDGSCNVCGTTRTVKHKFSSSTDITCDVCNEECGYLARGEWSEWQDTEIVPGDDSIEVDVPRQVVIGYNQKTQYKYSRYYGYYKEGGYYLALDYSSGICTNYEETDWLDFQLEYKSYTNRKGVVSWGYGMNVLDNKYIHWYNEETRTVDDLNSPIYKKQYRYREVYAVYY